ncbi:MAG: hypothetical protein HY648_00500, partial [Acidobacteria bacterium]|nr:hypothetical protein [Acidobacteriota bacterium]
MRIKKQSSCSFITMMLCAASLWLGGYLQAQGPVLTTVRDTVYKSDGSLASGTVVITWRPFVAADSKPVFGGTKTVPLANGALAVALVPNDGGTPSGTSYNVKYYQSGSVFSEETWVVPSSSALPSPGAPVVANWGEAGSTVYHYWVSAKNTDGETLPGPAATTTTSNSSLSGANYNEISWNAVSGATSYRVWRTATATVPSGTGNYLVGETSETSLDDQSNALQQGTIPSVNDTDPRTLADVRVTATPSSTVTLAATQVSGTAIVSNPDKTQTINAPPKAGTVPLQIKGQPQANANILEVYDSQPSPVLQSYFNPQGAFVTQKVLTAPKLGVSADSWFAGYYSIETAEVFTPSVANPYMAGIAAYPRFSPSADSTSGFLIGADLASFADGSKNIAALLGATGIGVALPTYSGTLSDGAGLYGFFDHKGSGTVANAYGLWLKSNVDSSSGSITSNYGLKIEDQTAGTNNWAILTGLGKVQFGDTVAAPAINNIRFADQFPGANAAAKIAAALADLPSTGGVVDARGFTGNQTLSGFTVTKANVHILFNPGAAWTITGSIIIRAQNTWLDFQGASVTSSLDDKAIYIDGSTATGNAALTAPPYLNGKITGLHLTGNSGANAVGIKQVDCNGCVYDDVALEGFTGVNSAGLWLDNQAGPSGGFSERTSFRKIAFRDNTKGLRMTVTGGHNSVMYTVMTETHFGVEDGQIGWSIEGTGALNSLALFNSTIQFMANVNDPVTPGTVLKISDGASIQGGWFQMLAEETTGSGAIGVKIADLNSYLVAQGTLTFNGTTPVSTPTLLTSTNWPLGRFLLNAKPLTIFDDTVSNVTQRTSRLDLGDGGATFALPSYAGVENNGVFQVYARDTGDLRKEVSVTVYPPIFTGSGLNDMTSAGEFTGGASDSYTVVIDGTAIPNTFQWKKGEGSFTTGVPISGSPQTLSLGVIVTFGSATGHTLGDQWVVGVGNTKVPLIYTDALSKKVGIGTASPLSRLDVSGAIRSTME